MKKTVVFITALYFIAAVQSCKTAGGLDDSDEVKTTITGTQSPMGNVGVQVTSTQTIPGVTNITGSVTTLSNGISTYTGTAVITNTAIKNFLANAPEVTISGNNVTVTNLKLKVTSDGIESVSGLDPGIIVKYSSNVGDKYQIGNTSRYRTVLDKSTTDSYPWNGMYIKVMVISEDSIDAGISRVIYYANHKYGLVGMAVTFSDNSIVQFPIYQTASN